MQDSGVDIEAYIVKMLATRLGRILNTRFTTGNGTGQPRGITIDAVLGVTSTTGKAQLPQFNDIIALKYSVDRMYRPNAKWMMSDHTWKACLELVDSNGRPLILGYLTGLAADAAETLLSQPVIINNDMADYGTNGSPLAGNIDMLYGDFSNYWIRTVAELNMKRLIERYADYDQVGLIGFARYDGRLIDAGTGPVKYMVSPTS
jgi:HK97 family phage major capsid protein